MSDKRVILLSDKDVVLYAPSSPDAFKAMFRQCYESARRRLIEDGGEWTDADGEIHSRRWRLVFGEDTEDITTKQRGFLHAAVFPQIAEQAVVNGVGATAKGWKDWYRDQFLGWKWAKFEVVGKKTKAGNPLFRRKKVRVSTEDLSVQQYSAYIDRVIAHAVTEFGVEFVFDEDERQSVRYQPKRRKQREEAVA